MEYYIKMPRGDLFMYPFAMEMEDGTVYTGQLDSIYFTVKKSFFDGEVVFQKRLSNGTIEDNGDGTYLIRIEPEDTQNLNFGIYDFDIQVEKVDQIVELKQTFYGKLELTEEVTHSTDEVDPHEDEGHTDPGDVDVIINGEIYKVTSTAEVQAVIDSYESRQEG